MTNYTYYIKKLIVLVIILILSNIAHAGYNNLRKVNDLSGSWKFSIGDNKEWAQHNFDDANWQKVHVPEKWESQGFYGYNGFAWYRKTFYYENDAAQQPLYLSLGYIDDVDEVYINGKLIGKTGSFPPFYTTAYSAKRMYRIPSNLLKSEGKNVIAVRVYDEGGEGGIVNGNVAIFADFSAIPVDFSLQGKWKFKTDNCTVKENAECDFSTWDDILVPGFWEDQGYKHFNGIACYALKFSVDDRFNNQDIVLVLGKIDDVEEVYLNGKLIGKSADIDASRMWNHEHMHKQQRGYYLPKNALKSNTENVLFIKVKDYGGGGGIYEGQIGFITQKNYITYWNNKRRGSNHW